MHDEGIFENVAQKAEARHDRRIAEIVGRDVDDGHGDSVAALGAFDENRTGKRMHEIEINRSQVLRLGVEGEIGIKRIARLEHEKLPWIDMRRRLDGVVIAIETVRVVFAMLS